jgi:hypothetical protein
MSSPAVAPGELVAAPVLQWVLDENAPRCMQCGAIFTLLLRRHHCRICGIVVCRHCCVERVQIPGTLVHKRACVACTEKVHLQMARGDRDRPWARQGSANRSSPGTIIAPSGLMMPAKPPSSPPTTASLTPKSSLGTSAESFGNYVADAAAKTEDDMVTVLLD